MNKIKKVTHAIALVGGSLVAWSFSDKGQAVLSAVYHAYPKATVISSVLAVLAMIYHNPRQSQ